MQSPFAGMRSTVSTLPEIVVAPSVKEPRELKISGHYRALPRTGFEPAISKQTYSKTLTLAEGWTKDAKLKSMEEARVSGFAKASRDAFVKQWDGKATFGGNIDRDTIQIVTRIEFA
jgi:hypothetical protein